MFVDHRNPVVGENQQTLAAPAAVLHQRGHARRFQTLQSNLFELLQHRVHFKAAAVNDWGFRLTIRRRTSVRLRMAFLPVGRAKKTKSPTATVIANDKLNRPISHDTVANQGRATPTAPRAHSEAAA